MSRVITEDDLKSILEKLPSKNIPGEIKQYAGSTIPTGWLECDGSEVVISEYPLLFEAIGNSWGTASDNNHFKLPDLRGKTLVGYLSSDTDFNSVGKTGGASTHYHTTGNCTLTANQSGVKAHSHGHTFALSNNTQLIYSTDSVGATRGTISTSSSATTSFIRKTYNASGTAGLRSVGFSGSISNATATNASEAHNHGNTQTVSNYQPYAVVKYIIYAV